VRRVALVRWWHLRAVSGERCLGQQGKLLAIVGKKGRMSAEKMLEKFSRLSGPDHESESD